MRFLGLIFFFSVVLEAAPIRVRLFKYQKQLNISGYGLRFFADGKNLTSLSLLKSELTLSGQVIHGR
ncbi:MAG: hypothetical protein D6797_01315, partial [Bdellovibrio sp.]